MLFALAVAVWAVRDIQYGPRVNTDGVRDLMAAVSAARGHGLPDRGPGIHGQHFGSLGPLYYLLLAGALALGRSVEALGVLIFAWHVLGTLALFELARIALGQRAWVAVIISLFASRATVALDLEHESFVMLPTALAGVCALRHEREGQGAWLLGAFLAAGVAVQLQSLAALGVLTLAVLRWRSRLVVSVALALGCVAAWTAPFLLTLVGPWTGRAEAPVDPPTSLLRHSLVPITSVVIFTAAIGQRALHRVERRVLALVALPSLLVLAWPLARDATELRLGYFTYSVPIVTTRERVDNGGPDRTDAVVLLAVLLALATRARRRRDGDVDHDLVVRGALAGATPGVLLYLLHPADRFLAHCVPWLALAIAALLPDAFDALPLRRRGYLFAAVVLFAFVDLVVGPLREFHEADANSSHLAIESRSVRALGRRVGSRPSALLAVIHGLDPCGRSFGAWGMASRVEVAVDAMRGEAPRPDRHLRFEGGQTCRPLDRFSGTVSTYVPRLQYARAVVHDDPDVALPIHSDECEPVRQRPAPYHRHGRCGGYDRPLRLTLPHAGPRAGDAVAVLVSHGELVSDCRFGTDVRNPLVVRVSQDGVALTGNVTRHGNPGVTTFALRPSDGAAILDVTVSGGRVMTLDVWEP